MKTHRVKIEPNFLEDLLSGDKPFELRYNDRAYQKGDKLEFRKVNDPESWKSATADVSYVLSHHGLTEGWVILGLRNIKETK